MLKEHLFGTSGIRGEAETFLTNQFCFDIGRSFATHLKNRLKTDFKPVVAIGSDPRESSPRIKEHLIKGLAFEGVKIFDEGVVSIPAMNYVLIARPELSGSIMVTGSHIKSHLNGIKFFIGNEEILKPDEKSIASIYEKIKNDVPVLVHVESEVTVSEAAKSEYIEYLSSLSKLKYKKWKVVVDAGNGAQSDIIPDVLRKYGLNVVEFNCSFQQEFMARDTEVESEFESLKQKVLSEKADFGIGFDSDGDRAVFVDETGRYIYGDYSGTILSKFADSKKIATPINVSSVIDTLGKEVIRTKVGSPYVVAAMKQHSARFGFEANGGCIFNNMKSRDGGRTAVEMLNILAKTKLKLSELVNTLPQTVILRDKVEYKWEQEEKILTKARETFKDNEVVETDGLKFILDKHTWILFRSSKNAPEFRIFVESTEPERAQELMKQGMDIVNSIAKA